ncbi:MAG TPA: hypothetical protein VJ521_04490 [Acidobacteriota bacterium]|nr:hypothetical protein [Acidobacteriota bacterium]
MKSHIVPVLLVFAILGFFAAGGSADSVALRIVVVETDQPDVYLQEIEKGKQLMKKLESPGMIRVWRARFAGPEAGMVVVSIEYPSMTLLVADESKLYANAEWQTWLKGLDKIRKVKSDSIYYEMKP